MAALGLVIAIELLQFTIEQVGESVYAGRRRGELYQPLVTALGVAIHIDGCHGIFRHLRTCLGTSVGKSLFRVVHDKFLAKSIDEILSATRDDKLIGILAGETDGVSYHVTPQSARGGNDHGVILVQFNACQRNYRRIGTVKLIHGDKLIEHTIIQHQEHGAVGWIVLQSKETLAGVIGLHVVHVVGRYHPLILLAIRSEGDTAMEEALQVGPHLIEVLLSGEFQHPDQYAQHPRGNSRDIGNVLSHGLLGYTVTLQLEIAQQGSGLARHPHHIGQGIDIFYQDGAQVSHQAVRQIVVGRMAASQYQALAVEEAALGMVAQIKSHGIETALIMYVAQSLISDGDKLAFVIGGA